MVTPEDKAAIHPRTS